jgi:hypothetical protein
MAWSRGGTIHARASPQASRQNQSVSHLPWTPAAPILPRMADSSRLCPDCRLRMAEAVCLVHGLATLRMDGGDAPHGLVRGEVVAGRYRIVQQIGAGGYGVVYLAEHLYGLGQVAIKTLRMGDARDEQVLRFHREARITAALRHPNTVRVLDFGQTESGLLYLAMEHLEGRTLESDLRDREVEGRPMVEAEALALAEDVLAGLQAAHDAGLVHRDLKPCNLFLCTSGDRTVVRILDFGIAHVSGSELTASRRAVGTPAYMSPEQCQDQAIDGRADLYALGIILFRCVSGRLPFRAESDMALLWAHVHQPAPDVLSAARAPISPTFAAVLARALAKDPNQRPASASAMHRQLQGEAIEDAPALEPPPRRAARLRYLGGSVAIACVLAAWLGAPASSTPATAESSPRPVPRAVAAPAPVAPLAAPAPASVAAAPLAAPAPEAVIPAPRPEHAGPVSAARRIVHRGPRAVPPPRYRLEDLP